MLQEYAPTRQVKGEPTRRWFHSRLCDLIVWVDDSQVPLGFQFCYDKGGEEHALSWKHDLGFSHMAVDSGEMMAGAFKAAPILRADGACDSKRILEMFRDESRQLPNDYIAFIARKIQQLGEQTAEVR